MGLQEYLPSPQRDADPAPHLLFPPPSRHAPSPPRAPCAQRWELENNIVEVDSIYNYDAAQDSRWKQERKWTTDPKYFKHVRISALALIKMVMHARSGGTLEIIGIMQGKIDPNDPKGPTLIVMDAFALPVEGTETRVNPMVRGSRRARAPPRAARADGRAPSPGRGPRRPARRRTRTSTS